MSSIKFSFKQTIPVLFGYVFMGAANGLLLQRAGFNFIWVFFISVFVYAGSGQFLLVALLSGGASVLNTAVMQLSINSRHFFYGLSFLEKFKKMGKAYLYMIFSLTDETYSLLCAVKPPKELNESKVYLQIAALNHGYWIFGCTAGALLGTLITFETKGIDFTMTALFVVILIEQWKAPTARLPAVIGGGCAAFCLLIFGADGFILPALLLTICLLMVFKKHIARVKEEAVR